MAYSKTLAGQQLPDWLQAGLVIFVTVSIFLVDILASFDIKILLLYCIVIAVAPLILKNLRTTTIARLITVLIVLGYFIPDMTEELWPEGTRRLLTILTVWVITYVVRNFSKFEHLEKSIFVADSNAIIVINRLGKIELSNDAAEELFGYKGRELLRYCFVDLLPDNILDCATEAANGSKTIKPQLDRHITEIVHKSGARIPVEISTNRFHHDTEEYTTVIFRDISSLKDIETRLQHEHVLNEIIVNTTRSIIVILDSKADIISCNPYLEELTGHKREDVKDLNWFDIFIPKIDQPRIKDIFTSNINGVNTDGTVNAILTADGRKRIVIWSNSCMYDENDQVIGVLCTGQDITDRQLEQENLLMRTQQLGALSDIACQALQETDFRKLIQFVIKYLINTIPAAKIMYCELAEDKTCFHTWSMFEKSHSTFHETTIPVVKDSLAHQTLVRNQPICIQDFPAHRQIRKLTEINEQDFYSVLSVPVGADKAPVAVLCVYHDKSYEFTDREINLLESVTNILGIVVEKNRAKNQVEMLWQDRMKVSRLNLIGELGSHIAHEINQPLTSLMNYLESSKKLLHAKYGQIPEAIENLIEKTLSEAERASSIISNIRDYVETGLLNKTRVNINTVIEQTCELLSPQFSARRIALSFEPQSDLPAVSIDKMQIQQVLINVLNNSIEAMASSREKRIVITTCMEDAETVIVCIHDSGPGVIPAMLDADFRILIDVQKKGLGIGLSICQSIIAAHHGKCWFSESIQGGATFNFTLPVNE